MLALDRRYGAQAGFDAARIHGVVGLAGPYDFKLDRPLLRSMHTARTAQVIQARKLAC